WSAWLAGLLGRLDFFAEVSVCHWAGGDARQLVGPQGVGAPLGLPADLRLALKDLEGHVVLLRGGRWLDLWPLHDWGRARTRSVRAPVEAVEAGPLVFL